MLRQSPTILESLRALVSSIEASGLITVAEDWLKAQRGPVFTGDAADAVSLPNETSMEVSLIVNSFHQLQEISKKSDSELDIEELKEIKANLQSFEKIAQATPRKQSAEDKDEENILTTLQNKLKDSDVIMNSIEELKALIREEKADQIEAAKNKAAEEKIQKQKDKAERKKQEQEKAAREEAERKQKIARKQEEEKKQKEKRVALEKKLQTAKYNLESEIQEKAKKNHSITKLFNNLQKNIEIRKEEIIKTFKIRLKQILADTTASLKAEAVMQPGVKVDEVDEVDEAQTFTDRYRKMKVTRSVLQNAIKDQEENPNSDSNVLKKFYSTDRNPTSTVIKYAMVKAGYYGFISEASAEFTSIPGIDEEAKVNFIGANEKLLEETLLEEGEVFLKNNKEIITAGKKQFENDLTLYSENISFRHSRNHSVARLLKFIEKKNLTHEDVVKVLKTEYQAQIDYDIGSKQLLREGELARAIRAHLLKLGVNALELFTPKLPLEELTSNSALKLLSYIDETERSFNYKRALDKPHPELTDAGNIAHQLLLCKTNKQLEAVKDSIDTALSLHKEKKLSKILTSIFEDISTRLKHAPDNDTTFYSETADTKITSLYEDCIQALLDVKTNKEVIPNSYSNQGRFQLKCTKKKPIGIENKPDKHSLRDEVVGKLAAIEDDANIDNPTKITEMRLVIEKAKKELKGERGNEEFIQALEEASYKIKIFNIKTSYPSKKEQRMPLELFVKKLNSAHVSLPAFLARELNKISEMAASNKQSQEPLYQRYRLVLLDMWQKFDLYFNDEKIAMSQEEKSDLKKILQDVLLEDGIFKEDSTNKQLVVNTETLDKIKSDFPFSFHYQTLRMNLNRITKNRPGLFDDEEENIDKIDNQNITETAKLKKMNSEIIFFYLGLIEDENYRTYPTTKILKEHIKQMSFPDAINKGKAQQLFDDLSSGLRNWPTQRSQYRDGLIKKMEKINKSPDSDLLKYAKLRIVLCDAIEKVGDSMWGKPSLFGPGSRLYKRLTDLEKIEINKGQPEAVEDEEIKKISHKKPDLSQGKNKK